ncbi:hypothetical protein [Algisphaera agarilytica]|uniref:Uncharacterized protein n=1 Tax=Algisphaera agarilytica TaxID=1385975 RepID=A0A7X0H940_9BACT|nr:hypothetical protein [Algisphaera agarilytica]MBB6431540.1 hypothetical protein [Algisphaera agarilytica]
MATATKKTTAATTTANKKATAKQTAPVDEQPTAAKPKPRKPKAPGVQAKVTRPYLAGQIIAKHGLAAGVTPAMVAELNEAYGKPNDVESAFCLKNAHHAIRGATGLAEDQAYEDAAS